MIFCGDNDVIDITCRREMLAVEGLPAGGVVDLLIGGMGGTTGVVKAHEVYFTAEAGGSFLGQLLERTTSSCSS
jgi:hypothetical protein